MCSIEHSFSVAQIGNYPPSCGGVQLHISRLQKLLNRTGIPCNVYCPQSNQDVSEKVFTVHRPWWGKRYLNYWGYHWLTEYGFRCGETIIHCHEQWKMAPSMLNMLLIKEKKVIMTIHDQMIDQRWKKLLSFDRVASRLLVKNKRVWWIAVSENVRSQLLSLGVTDDKISVIPAFIPPLIDDNAEDKLPPVIQKFIDQHSPVISTYGWMLIFDEQGNDLHSFDHCIDLIKELKKDFPSIGLVVCIAAVTNHDYMAELRGRISTNGLENNILMLNEPLVDGHLLWKNSDLFLRATTTDGDSVSIREALSLQVPVVASDASVRPEGTVVFKARDLSSLITAVKTVLNDKELYSQFLDRIKVIETFPQILSLYRTIVEG